MNRKKFGPEIKLIESINMDLFAFTKKMI